MIYIKEYSFEKQISILDFLSNQEELDIIIWLFPESKNRNFCNINLAPKGLMEGKPITTYDDNFQAKRTKRVKVTKDLISKIQNEKKSISENCDSLALYRPKSEEWLACTLEHENIVLINDDNLLESIINQGFKASLEKTTY